MEQRNARLRKEFALFLKAFPQDDPEDAQSIDPPPEEWQQIRPESPTGHEANGVKKPTGKQSFAVDKVPDGAKLFPLNRDF